MRHPFTLSGFLTGITWLMFALSLSLNGYMHAQVIPSRPVALLDHQAGLHDHVNYFMYQDSRGFLWLSSISGLYQYDGKNLRLHAATHEVHSFICEDDQGDLWFGVWTGIMCYVRNSDTIRTISLPDANPSHRFFVCGIDSLDQLWFTHSNGIYTFDLNTETFQLRAPFHAMLWNSELQLDKKGQVKYIYSYNRYPTWPGLYIHHFEDSEYKQSTEILKPPAFDTMAVSDVHIISDTSLLIATQYGIFQYNVETNTLKNHNPYGSDYPWKVNCMTRLTDTTILVGTYNDGFFIFNTQSHTFSDQHTISYKGERMVENPFTMYTDRDGGVWIHLEHRGVAFYHPRMQVFTHYPLDVEGPDQMLSFTPQTIAEGYQKTVIATSENSGAFLIYTSDGQSIDSVVSCAQCPPRIKRAFADSRGDIWLTPLYRNPVLLDTAMVVHSVDTDTFPVDFRFAELRDGRVINVSGGELLISDYPGSDSYSFSKLNTGDHPYQFLEAIAHTNGLLFTVCVHKLTKEMLLVIMDPGHNFLIVKTHPLERSFHSVLSIPESDDAILVTRQGISYYHHAVDRIERIPTCCDDFVLWGMVPLRDTEYLLCSTDGICLFDLMTRACKHLGREHGLGIPGVTWYGILRHSTGNIWLANSTGISIGNSKHLEITEITPKLNITDFRINDRLGLKEIVGDHDSNPNDIRSLRLSNKYSTLTFHFAGLSYAGVDAYDYEYRLAGLEEEWVDDGNQGFARYLNIPPGAHRFEVRAKDYPHSVRGLDIHITPPFYRTSWFLGISIATVILLIYLFVALYERRKQRLMQLRYEKQLAVEQERLRISNNLHDDLGSGLSALNLRAQMIVQHMEDSAGRSQVTQLATHTEKLVEQIRETIWTTSAEYDTLDNLITHIHQYAHTFFRHSDIRVSVHLPSVQTAASIPGTHRREIYLAFKEALHNVLKHSRATSVDIHITYLQPTVLSISIQDNGQGFDPITVRTGHGLESMRKRMEDSGGACQISSDPEGSMVCLVYPVLN